MPWSCVPELVVTDTMPGFRSMLADLAAKPLDLKKSDAVNLIAFDVLISSTDWSTHWSEIMRGAESIESLHARVRAHCEVTLPCDLAGSKDRLTGSASQGKLPEKQPAEKQDDGPHHQPPESNVPEKVAEGYMA